MRALDFALSRILPEDLRQDSYDMSKKGVATLMSSLAREHPDRYREVVKRIGDLGRRSAFLQGYTIGPGDTQPVISTREYFDRMDAELKDLRSKNLPPDDFDEARNEILQRYSDVIEKDTMGAALKSDNAFARAVASGARGNPAHVKAILSTPGVYADATGNIIPLFVRNSFARGVRPAETLAGTYGARSAVISTKVATAKGGDYCLAAGTMVRMADYTTRAIETLRPGDWVLGADKTGLTFPVQVVRLFDQGTKTVMDYRFTDGRKKSHFVETCTAEHKFLVDYLRRNAVDVLPVGKAKGNRYGYIRPSGFDDTGLPDHPGALLLGLLLGDGSMPKAKAKSRVGFACFDESLIRDTASYMGVMGLKWARRPSYPQQFRVSKVDGSDAYCGFRSQLLEWGVAGHRPHTQVVPEVVRTWSNKSVADLLRGFFATAGCVTVRSANGHGERRHYYACTSVSRELLCGLRDLLQWRFGVNGSQVTEVRDAGQQVILGNLCNTKAAFTWQVASASDVAVMDRIMRTAPGEKGRAAAEVADTCYAPIRKLGNVATCHRAPTGTREMPCWDIEVDHPDHLFVLASNLICSNSKILNQSTSHYNVTEADCGVRNGLDFEPGDASLRGRVLARDLGDLKAGSVIDKRALAAIRKQDKPVIARSPLTCKSSHGVCAWCAGLQPDGNFPRIGDSFGITAGQSVGEPIVQSGLNAKHNAGAAKGKKEFSGFDVVSQFAQIPDEFKDKATVAEEEGIVTAVREAPQGGHYVTVNNRQHFVLPGFELMVKPGDSVEAGDQLADGLVNPADIVRLRGLGEGRRYYADRLEKILQDSGQPPDRRNIELIARATVDHVRVEDPDEDSDFLPDDLVREADLMAKYKAPADTEDTPLPKLAGRYLQQPVLHFTVGTKVTPKMAERMRKAGVTTALASQTEPYFKPDMQRLRTASHSDRDWMASLSTSYLSKQMVESAERGDDTDVGSNYHYAPRLAVGVGFGENIEQTGKF